MFGGCVTSSASSPLARSRPLRLRDAVGDARSAPCEPTMRPPGQAHSGSRNDSSALSRCFVWRGMVTVEQARAEVARGPPRRRRSMSAMARPVDGSRRGPRMAARFSGSGSENRVELDAWRRQAAPAPSKARPSVTRAERYDGMALRDPAVQVAIASSNRPVRRYSSASAANAIDAGSSWTRRRKILDPRVVRHPRLDTVTVTGFVDHRLAADVVGDRQGHVVGAAAEYTGGCAWTPRPGAAVAEVPRVADDGPARRRDRRAAVEVDRRRSAGLVGEK